MEFYDVGSSDLRELWESYLVEPALGQDVLMATREEEWGNVLCLREKGTLGVVLRDRLMTDAALGGTGPIKSEHSYSLSACCSPPASPAIPERTDRRGSDSASTRQTINDIVEHHNKTLGLRARIDDMEEECYPAISMDTASGRSASSPMRPRRSCSDRVADPTPARPRSLAEDIDRDEIKGEEPLSAPNTRPRRLHFAMIQPIRARISEDSEEEEEEEEEAAEYYQSMELEESEMKREGNETSGNGSRRSLPPTPPSSASSDSEGTASASCSPERRDSRSCRGRGQNLGGILGPGFYATNANHAHATRQPIHTCLISCQPKGSTGLLALTDEEKRTLVAEGYPIPTKLPLTKQEEKSLKKVRRKIKNKISAQESRRKKKEYMDGLERRVTALTNENTSYRDRLSSLEEANRQLVLELQRLRTLIEAQQSSDNFL